MTKFFSLIQNEYIKSLRRISTRIMLVLIILAGIALPSFAKFIEKTNRDSYNYYYTDFTEDYRNAIDYAKEAKNDGWENEVALYEALIAANVPRDDWRYEAAENGYYQLKISAALSGDESIIAGVDDICADFIDAFNNSDWKKFYQAHIDATYLLNSDDERAKAYAWRYQYCLDNNIEPCEHYLWTTTIYSEIGELKQFEYDYSADPSAFADMDPNDVIKNKDDLIIKEYMLANGIETNVSNSSELWYNSDQVNFWNVFASTSKLITVVGLLIIVVAGGIVASEFSEGTVKFLLINPAKRWKIMIAKYFTAISLGYIMIILLYITSLITTMILYGVPGNAASLSLADGIVHEGNAYLYVLKTCMIAGVSVIIMASLAFAVSTLVRSSALSIGIGMFAFLTGNTINMILAELSLPWAKYLIFANTDLNAIASGQSMYFNHTLPIALGVIAVHMIIYAFIAWDGFVRREV